MMTVILLININCVFNHFFLFFYQCRVKQWADKFGAELWHLGEFITRREKIQEVIKQIMTHNCIQQCCSRHRYLIDLFFMNIL
jgi:hypothetical protein